IGAILLNFIVLPPHLVLGISSPQDFTEVVFFVGVAVTISAFASQTEKARRSNTALAGTLAIERAQLATVIDAVPDAIAIYSSTGALIRRNRASQERTASSIGDTSLGESAQTFGLYTNKGELFRAEELPVTRALRGESVTDLEMVRQDADGAEHILTVSVAPFRNRAGHLVGAVAISHDVTEQRRLDHRAHVALNALLAMAEALMDRADEAQPDSTRSHPFQPIARRLAELACRVMGAARAGIATIDTATNTMRALAVAGLSPDEEQRWWSLQRPDVRFDEGIRAPTAEQLRQGNVVVGDLSDPAYANTPNPFHVSTFLIAPMRIGERLVGILTLDHSGERHHYTANEIALAEGVARLAALAIERERLLREREDARAHALALRNANERMDEFIGIASHEMRTPLTTIKANVQMVNRYMVRLTDPWKAGADSLPSRVEKIKLMLYRTDRQVERLNRLVGDLIDVSRIRANKLELHTTHCDLSAIVREIVLEQRQAHPERQVHMELVPYEGVMIEADADRIGQVLTNYLTNSLKYSPPDTPVEVQMYVNSGQACVTVTDHGPGLPPGEHERIWERFHRVQGIEVQSESGVGLGLGLHISRTIVERHLGHVGVESTLGRGATFWFMLPLAET
ncbi:MAG TPA: ATP-binding protein, partial [Ktedonobacterales bacterium]|nr:ATP-binding protein [Ktedonobacterales bacterium]